MAKLATHFYRAKTSLLKEILLMITCSLAGQPSTLGPEIATTPALTNMGQNAVSLRKPSAGSSHLTSVPLPLPQSLSSVSIPFEDSSVDVVRVEGLRHADGKLEARRYRTPSFAEGLLVILRTLHIPTWVGEDITPQTLQITKVSGSLTNAVFFVSCPSLPHTRVLLLRIYGPSSGALISRPRELHTLHALSSQYRIGPRVYGTFENGRVEEFFDSTALTPADLRDRRISGWIGARMAELHCVDIAAVEKVTPTQGEGAGWEIGAKKNVEMWLGLARDVLALPSVSDTIRRALDLDAFQMEWKRYVGWLFEEEKSIGASARVFSHNDAQYGNLLKLHALKEGTPQHRQIIVVDFEYASPNPAAFDIANHFHEWTANYHSDTPHILNPARYPTSDERRNFYYAYLTHHMSNDSTVTPTLTPEELESEMQTLEKQVRAWSPASHAMWSVWGVVQAREDVEAKESNPEFDYLGYSQGRMDAFRREIRALGI